MALYHWLLTLPNVSDVVLEAWLPDTHQRPDIMFRQNGHLYVLEYQCTPIATEFFERHDLYRAAGIKDIWICGYEKYLQPNMRTKTIDQFCAGYYSVADDILVLNPADNASKAVGYVTRRCGREAQSFLGYIECEYVQYKHERIPMLSTTLNNAYLDEGTVELTKLPHSPKIIAKCNCRSEHCYYPVEYTYNNVFEHIRYIYRKQGCDVYSENNSIYVDFHMNTLLGIMNESHRYCARNQKEWALPDIRYLIRTINNEIRECKRKYSAIRKTLNRIAIEDNPTLLLYPAQGKRYPLKVGARIYRVSATSFLNR